MSEIIKILGKQVRGCDGTILVPKKKPSWVQMVLSRTSEPHEEPF